MLAGGKSSRMNESLPGVLNGMLKYIHPNQPVVMETGDLCDYMEPGLLLYITGENPEIYETIRNDSKVIKLSSSGVRHFNRDPIQFINGKFFADACL